MIDPVMGAAGVDPNWTAEEWTAVLKQALDERDEARSVARNLLQDPPRDSIQVSGWLHIYPWLKGI